MKSFIGFASECHCHWVCVECAPRLPSSKKSYRSDVQRNIFQMCLQIQKGWTLSYRILNVCGNSGCNWWIRFGSIGFGPIWVKNAKVTIFDSIWPLWGCFLTQSPLHWYHNNYIVTFFLRPALCFLGRICKLPSYWLLQRGLFFSLYLFCFYLFVFGRG